LAFHIWGDTVNIASHMESAGEPGKVNVSAYTYYLIRKEFVCEYREKLDAKGKGAVDMYFVVGVASPTANAT
jgi:class 3 adenylate cyclase